MTWSATKQAAQSVTYATFGTAVLYRVGGADPAVALANGGRFRDAHTESLALTSVDLEVSETQPSVRVLAADLPAGALLTEDDTVEIAGELFRVENEEPTGHGEILLLLKEVSP